MVALLPSVMIVAMESMSGMKDVLGTEAVISLIVWRQVANELVGVLEATIDLMCLHFH